MTVQELKRRVARYKGRPWRHARMFNDLNRDVRRVFPEHIYVPRKSIWMHNDLPVQPMPPLVKEIRLGQAYVDACLLLELDWTKHQRWCPKHLRDLRILDTTLGELWQTAKDQVNWYFYEYGYLDDEYHNLRPRKPRIGDTVEIVRHQAPRFKYFGPDNIVPDWEDTVLAEWGEPEEEIHDTLKPGIPASGSRYDSDARWEQMSFAQQEVVYEVEEIDGKLVHGSWMSPLRAKELCGDKVEHMPWTHVKHKVRKGDGSIVFKEQWFVFVDKADLAFG